VKQESSSGTVFNDEKFTYDINNNRIAVSLNGTPELYTVYDGSNPCLDFNGSGQLTERYLYNPNALSQFYGQVSANGTVQWFLTDNINSIRQVVSASGSVLDLITYDPYGNILSQTNAANAPRFLYAGGAYDSLTGQYQFGRRYYNPADGRWTSQDPLGFKAGDTDLYRYVRNVPTSSTDPNGLCACQQKQRTRKVLETKDWFVIVALPLPRKGWYYGWTRLERVEVEIKAGGKKVETITRWEFVFPPIWRKKGEGPPKEK